MALILAASLGGLALAQAASAEAPAPSLAEYIAALCSAAFRSTPPHEAPFMAENVAAMTGMIDGMEIKPSGDVDSDFTRMMTAHHQAAIDMAISELRYGQNQRLHRLAQEIIVTQQQEIAAMRLALGRALPPSAAAPDQPTDLLAGAQRTTRTPELAARKEP